MPGTAGHGRGALRVTVDVPDVSTLPQNSPVMHDDVTIGSIATIAARQRRDGTFYAEVTLALNPDVALPANCEAKVAQTSLLGSQHIELAPPAATTPTGALRAGARIPISRSGHSPSTEEVLSALGVVVNKGNLGALGEITDELYQAVAGRAGHFTDLLPRLAELTASIDAQSNDILAAVDHLNRFAATVAHSSNALSDALQSLPAALQILNSDGDTIVATFAALRRLADVAAHTLARTKTDFAADVKEANAVIAPLADNINKLIDALPIIPAFPLPLNGVPRAVRGDFLNTFLTLDLTVRRLGENIFTTSGLDANMKHLAEVVKPPEFLIGELAGLSGQAADPFQIPAPPSPNTGR